MSVAKNNLETLYLGPSKHDLFLARRKPKTVSRENTGSVPLPGGSYSRWLPPRGQKRIHWISLCGSLHSGSTNSGSLHTARSRLVYRRIFVYVNHFHARHVFVGSESWTYHGWDGAGRRTAARRAAGPGRGEAQRGGARWHGGGSMRPGEYKPSISPARAPRTPALDISSEARTKEIQCKPVKEHNVQLTTGFITRTARALRSYLLTNGPTFSLCPDMPCMRRVYKDK